MDKGVIIEDASPDEVFSLIMKEQENSLENTMM